MFFGGGAGAAPPGQRLNFVVIVAPRSSPDSNGRIDGVKDAAEIDARMERDGFPEMERLWTRFKRRRKPIPDNATLRRWRRAHMAARWLPVVLGVTAGIAFPLPMSVGVAFLTWYAVLSIQRYVISPFARIMECDLAFMLSGGDFVRPRDGMHDVHPLWDNPAYRSPPLPDPTEFVRACLRDLLGCKVDRRFRPGRFHDSLRDKKQSVTRFVKTFGDRLRKPDANLLRELRAEVLPESPGANRIAEALRAIDEGHYLVASEVRAEIWQRDPWIDLTHQEEFFSSASLRGVKWIGRGPKGRIGTFGYLRNPSISALDFRTKDGRQVRARIALAETETGTDSGPGISLRVLFVDGVEGTNAIAPRIILEGLRDYAVAMGVAAVVFNGHTHNMVPKRILRHLDAPVREVKLRYLDDTEREYLDAFTLPIEPFEYAYPRGTVVGPVVDLDSGGDPEPGDLDSERGAVVGRAPRPLSRVLAALRLQALWLFTLPAFGAALWMVARERPEMLWGLGTFFALGVVLHLVFQRRSLSS